MNEPRTIIEFSDAELAPDYFLFVLALLVAASIGWIIFSLA
jgi:hypothetical protein